MQQIGVSAGNFALSCHLYCQALVFTPTVRTAYAIADAFRAAGLAAEALDGSPVRAALA
jgi:hypothetical protein